MSDETVPTPPTKTAAEKLAEAKAQKESLDRVERKTGSSGAVPFAPKQALLNADDLVKANPDKHYRWVSVANAEKTQARQAQGYTRVPVAEGGRQVGNLALFESSKEGHDQRVAQVKKLNKDRLAAHQTEVERMADGVARELRDRHGINVDADRIFIKE